jgi:hypothetical protein
LLGPRDEQEDENIEASLEFDTYLALANSMILLACLSFQKLSL